MLLLIEDRLLEKREPVVIEANIDWEIGQLDCIEFDCVFYLNMIILLKIKNKNVELTLHVRDHVHDHAHAHARGRHQHWQAARQQTLRQE